MNLPWPPADGSLLVILVAASALFPLYRYRFDWTRLQPRFGEGDRAHIAAVHAQRIAGAILLGVIPAVLIAVTRPRSPTDLGLTLPDPAATAIGVGIILALALPAVLLASRKPNFIEDYPQIRARGWTTGLKVANAATWTLYLIGYEFFFRGVLLFTLVELVDPWTAIGLNAALYVYAHLHKNGAETAGTVPMGVVFAAITLWSGSIWAPVIGHVIIANTGDLLAARRRG